MKKIFLTTMIMCCVSALSAQDDSDLVGKYTITEYCMEVITYHVGYENTHDIEIVLDTNNEDLLLNGIRNKLKIEPIGDGFFSINEQNFIYDYDSTVLSVSGLGVVKNNSFYLFYHYGGSAGVMNNICVGFRKTNNVNLTNFKSYNSGPCTDHMIGEYGITVFSKERNGDKKSYECESIVKIDSNNNKPMLTGIIGQLNVEPLDSNFFFLNDSGFNSAELWASGFGLVKNDSIYIYFSKNENSVSTEGFCIGIRMHKSELSTSIIQKTSAQTAMLCQNSPNPFRTQTEILYYLPENAENAVINVFSLNGNMLLSKPLTKTGNGSITISGSELEAGMYIYTLAIGGVEVDSKRMILNNQ